VRTKGETIGVVDFGSRDVRVLIARKEGETIAVTGHGTAPARGCVSRGVVQDLSAAESALGKALAEAEDRAHAHMSTLFCGINGTKVDSSIREGKHTLTHERVDREDMKQAHENAATEAAEAGKRIVSSISAQEWFVDGLRVANPLNIRGQVLKTRVHLAQLPSVIVDNLAACVLSQHRRIEDMIFLPVANALGCLTPEDMELGVAVLDLGHNTTGMALYRGRSILDTFVIPVGGNDIVNDVAGGLSTSFLEAEELVLEYGVPDALIRTDGEAGPEGAPGRDVNPLIKLHHAVRSARDSVERGALDRIIYLRAKEILTKMRQHLHKKDLMNNLVRGIVLTGGGSMLKNQVALAESVFEVPCQVGLPENISVPKEIHTPEFVSAVGIAHHAFEFRKAVREKRIDSANTSPSGIRMVLDAIRQLFF